MAETFINNNIATLSTTDVDLIAGPAGNAADVSIVLSVMVTSANGSAAAVSLQLVDSSDGLLCNVANNISVPAGSALELVANKLVVKNGQKLRINAPSGSLAVLASALEITV